MNFRNVVLFRFPSSFEGMFQTPTAEAFDSLADSLAEARLKPVGPMELYSSGFVSPYGVHSDLLVQRVQDKLGISIGTEKRLLPASVINDRLQKKLEEIEEQEGRRPGGRTRKRLKDDLIMELLPQAFVEPSRVYAYFDFGRSFIAVDTSSRGSAENVVSEVRRAAGSFPALPLNAEVAPRAVLTGWLTGDPMPDGLSIGNECELRDPADKGAVIRFSHIDLQGEEVQAHLAYGFQCTRLELSYQDHVSFVLGEDLVLRKFKLLEGAMGPLEEAERDDITQELDARFTLLAGELGGLFDMLAHALKISSADAGVVPQTDNAKPKARKRAKAMDGIDSVTITVAGHPPVTVSPDQFLKIGNITEKLVELSAWVRATGKTSISAMQRELKCGYNQAARVIELLESTGVVSAPDDTGTRTVLPHSKGTTP